MTLGEDRRALGEMRRLIFINYCNGVPREDLMVEHKCSAKEISDTLMFVVKKINEHRHQRCIQPHPDQGMLPPLPVSIEEDIVFNRKALLWTLDFIGDETLSTELILPNLVTQTVEYEPRQMLDAARAVRAA